MPETPLGLHRAVTAIAVLGAAAALIFGLLSILEGVNLLRGFGPGPDAEETRRGEAAVRDGAVLLLVAAAIIGLLGERAAAGLVALPAAAVVAFLVTTDSGLVWLVFLPAAVGALSGVVLAATRLWLRAASARARPFG